MSQNAQLRYLGRGCRQLGRPVIGAGIIDIDHLKPPPGEGVADFVDQRAYIACFIHHRHDDRNLQIR